MQFKIEFWERFRKKLEEFLKESILDEIYTFTSRTKSLESIRNKLRITRLGGRSNYSVDDISDVIGFRIVVLFNDDIVTTAEHVISLFKVHEIIVFGGENTRNNMSQIDSNIVMKFIEFDDSSAQVTMLLSVHPSRVAFPEWQAFSNIIFEIQIRTVFSDAWAAITHRLTYKQGQLSPDQLDKQPDITLELAQSVAAGFSKKLDQFKALLAKPNVHEKQDIHPFLLENKFIIHPNASDVFSEEAIGLGIQFRMDFVVREATGQYILVEIENSRHKLFNKSGDFSAIVGHAQRQVEDWQQWIEENIHLVRQRYPDMLAPMGMVVVGRKKELSQAERTRLARRNANMRGRMLILTYDDLIDSAQNFIEIIRSGPKTE